jgi:hypothetical protein
MHFCQTCEAVFRLSACFWGSHTSRSKGRLDYLAHINPGFILPNRRTRVMYRAKDGVGVYVELAEFEKLLNVHRMGGARPNAPKQVVQR